METNYSTGTYRLAADAGVTALGVNLTAMRHFNQWLPPGSVQRLQAGPVEVTIRDIVTGGNITVDTARRTLLQPGYKMAGEDLIYEIKTTAVSTQPIEIAIDFCNYSHNDEQQAGGRIMHCESGTEQCAFLPPEGPQPKCRVISKTTSLSPFGVMVPISDRTPPRTALSFIGHTRPEEDRLWVTTETYVALNADDEAAKGDTSGVARTLLLLDAEPTPECLASAHDPLAPAGSCANSGYGGAAPLPEGARLLNFSSYDNWGNTETFVRRVVHVDGTPPEVLLSSGAGAAPDGVELFVVEGDSVSLSAVDPESNGVASGLEEIHYYMNVDPADCPEDDGEDGPDEDLLPRGTCANHFYEEPFALSSGTHTVYYTAEDRVGNRAAYRTVKVMVSAPGEVVQEAARRAAEFYERTTRALKDIR